MPSTLMTIGYQGRSPQEMLSLIEQNDIDLVIDVRYRPMSRKRGFSKSALSELFNSHGIEYTHERDLGTPPMLLERVRSQRCYDDEARAEFVSYLAGVPEVMSAVATKTRGRRTCLVCYESDPTDCHRSIVADELGKRLRLRPKHL